MVSFKYIHKCKNIISNKHIEDELCFHFDKDNNLIRNNTNEVFRKTEYENYYVSNIGTVVSIKDNHNKLRFKILKQHTSFGYKRVSIICKGTKYIPLVHRLVAKAFIPNSNNYRYVNHKDENKENNDFNNLEWCTDEYNKTYSTGCKIIGISIHNKDIIKTFDSIRVASRILNIDYAAIRKCCINNQKYNDKTDKLYYYYKGYYWKYITPSSTGSLA